MANNLASARLHAGFSQTEMANALGVTQAAVAAWENGTNKPRYSMLAKIAQVLGCSISDVILSIDTQDEPA